MFIGTPETFSLALIAGISVWARGFIRPVAKEAWAEMVQLAHSQAPQQMSVPALSWPGGKLQGVPEGIPWTLGMAKRHF